MSVYDKENFKLDEVSRAVAKEMGEDPAQRMSLIETLRGRILDHKWVTCRTDDLFLLRFLRAGKFSVEAAKDRILKWCIARSSKLDGLPEWFENQTMKDPKLRAILESGIFYLMPKCDDLGRMVLIFDIERLKDCNKPSPVDLSRALYMVCEWVIFTYDRVQINGLVIIEAAANMDMEIMAYWTPERMKKSINIWQGAFPMRLKRLEYYNMPVVLRAFVDAAIALMKPKLQKRVKFHSDLKPADDIPMCCMPKNLDGGGPAFEDIKNDFLRALEDFEPEFQSFKDCKIDENTRPKHYEEGDDWGIMGSYRKTTSD